MKPASNWALVANPRDRVGEGPVWVPAESALYWVDILGQTIHRLSMLDGSLQDWRVPEPIGFIVPRLGQATGFVVGLQSGFHALQLEPFELVSWGDPEPHLTNNRLNDGKVDAHGRLWAGTMPMDGDTPDGTLYRFDPDHSWHSLDSGYRVTNGPAFSPAQDVLYHTDSANRVIYRFELDQAGGLHNKMPFIVFENDWGLPDGMTVDAVGYLWVAHWDGGRVSRFDPEGRLEHSVSLPASRITNCVFGGAGLDRLFVTSAREDREHQPLAGALFELAPGVTGVPAGAFAG
jgi:sugar lactone lactonase YvrE